MNQLNPFIEIVEASILQKPCFICIAGKHTTKFIETEAKSTEHAVVANLPPTIEAIAAKIEFDINEREKLSSLVSERVSIFFYDEADKEAVFSKAVAHSLHFLTDISINRGRFMVKNLLDKNIKFGKKRDFRDVSTLCKSPTNEKVFSMLLDVFDELNQDKNLRKNIIIEALETTPNEAVVHCNTENLTGSQNTINRLICLGAFMMPLRFNDSSEIIHWFQENYARENQKLDTLLLGKYQYNLDKLKESIIANAEAILKETDLDGDILNLQASNGFTNWTSINSSISKIAYTHSAALSLWNAMVFYESNEKKLAELSE